MVASHWHGYIAVEDMALTEDQRAAVVATFRDLGPTSDRNPAHLNARRVSLDGTKAIFEALFNEDHLTVNNVRQFLANAVDVNPDVIDAAVTQTARGPVVTYGAGGTDRMRFLLFGGTGATWEESRQQVLTYLRNNIAEWETIEE